MKATMIEVRLGCKYLCRIKTWGSGGEISASKHLEFIKAIGREIVLQAMYFQTKAASDRSPNEWAFMGVYESLYDTLGVSWLSQSQIEIIQEIKPEQFNA